MINSLPTDPLRVPQREVQRLLGRCLLRIQQYERLIKAIVAHHEICGTVSSLDAIRSARIAEASTKSLGLLVGKLLGSYLVHGSGRDTDLVGSDSAEAATVRMQFRLEMDAEDFERTQADLKDLVRLRNHLVHHLIDHHDVWTVPGCARARQALLTAYDRIDLHFEQLRSWAENMEQARQLAAEFVQSEVFRDLVINGIAPDGSVDWPRSGIVRLLRDAMSELSVDGWTSIAAAQRFIRAREPDQLPEKYGCRSFRQVVHQSRLFRLEYRDVNGSREACFTDRLR
ncbi:OST-HTH/LOTUS domain-containing protein [Stenotrophomonas sp. 364]|uniref:OST-HTH/LOTUS domain-containing protein n=1 Tax=Stenotrophomonas sp. 364 TaxID=2691571 RepID=UPI001317ECCA|nr:OST-HTH/LOTUS domain-containing protein [Stenotrophomonas sp. 364]QHB70713.1 hypothetical protein GQ674_04995 [Stenotrophomonas sp. 364]